MQELILMDRDGVINRERKGYVLHPEQLEFLPDALKALRLLNKNGFRAHILSNQSPVGRGLLSMEMLNKITRHMVEIIRQHGGNIESIQYCPHRPDEKCRCRKPRSGLFHNLERVYNVNLPRTWFVGDKLTDIQAAQAVGCRTILVNSGADKYDSSEGFPDESTPDFFAKNLYEAVTQIILKEDKQNKGEDMQYVNKYLNALKGVMDSINPDEVGEVIELLARAKEEGKNIFVVGNGGSAALSSHFVTDMAKGAYNEKIKNFKILSLCDNAPIITALGNDFGYEDIFVGQLRAYFQPGDVVMAISSSGNSPNVIKAIEYANNNGGLTIGLCGFKGGKLKEVAQKCVYVPREHYGLVEDAHGIVCHIIAYHFMEQAGNVKPLTEGERTE